MFWVVGGGFKFGVKDRDFGVMLKLRAQFLGGYNLRSSQTLYPPF